MSLVRKLNPADIPPIPLQYRRIIAEARKSGNGIYVVEMREAVAPDLAQEAADELNRRRIFAWVADTKLGPEYKSTFFRIDDANAVDQQERQSDEG